MKKRDDKNRTSGIIGTIIFHALIVLAFIFFGLSTPLPLPDEEGVEVNLGYTDAGSGIIQEEEIQETSPPPVPVQQPEPEPQESVEEENLTQDVEEAPALPDEKENEEEEIVQEEETEPERKPEPVENVQPEEQLEEQPEEVIEEKKPEVDPRALYKGNQQSDETGTNEGVTGEPGDQGMPTGTPEPKTYTGPGGAGNGISFSLGGRGALRLPKPEYNSQEQGKVVVTIWVDKDGKVKRAEAGAKGTNISDLNLRRLAENAALESFFAPDPNAPELQKGTITYNFIRLN